MIKIIISGTSDGFYPRYASDGVLDDEVSQRLLDRRRFLSRDADRLNKEGYSFQPLEGIGVLFHKLILLYDGFGRDGFMMASLFLPKGEVLEGNVIKEALDAVIREYKMHIVGGMANVELDWSFVKRKADEVNTKVRLMPWKKHLSPSDSSRTALIKGADNRVAEYFQFPNPLHPDCTGFGQVFLTESLLDPAMVSDNGEQGYKVIDVDIDNPIYEIHYNNPNGYSTFGLEHEVSKKKLDATDPFFCGTIKQSGFRELNVFIPADKKNSLDGITLEVDLPSLIKKEASVFIQVLGSDTTEIPWENCTINWKSNESYSLWENRIPTGRLYYFEKEECDRTWKLCVECDQYEKKEAEVEVNDRDKEKLVTISLRYNPTWTIVVTLPNKEESYFESQDKKDGRIIELISSLKGQGLEVDTPKENRNDRTVELKAKYPQWTIKSLMGSQKLKEESVSGNELEKRIEEWKRFYEGQDLEFEKRKDSERIAKLYFVKKQVTTFDTRNPRRENVFLDPTRNENVTKSESPKEPEKKKWVLPLDDDSERFSLFRNYKKRCELEAEAKNVLEKLDSCINRFVDTYEKKTSDKESKKVVNKIKGKMTFVKDELGSGTYERLENAIKAYKVARKSAKKAGFENDAVLNMLECANTAIKISKQYLGIPVVVSKPKSYAYDCSKHHIVVEQDEKPTEKPVFGKDHYTYSFVGKNLKWADDSDFYATKDKHEVVRRLQPKYKFLWFVLPLLVIGGVGSAWYFGFHEPPVNDEIEKLTARLEDAIDNLNNYKTYYCDDSLYNVYNSLPISYSTIKNKNEKKTDFKGKEIKKLDSVYVVFDEMFAAQKDFKKKDADIYAKLEYLKDSMNFWDNVQQSTFESLTIGTTFVDMIACMSNSHKIIVRKWYYERLQEKPEPTGTPHQGIGQHQQIINGPKTLFTASTYTNVMNGYEGYNFEFTRSCNYCISLKDSIILAVRTKNILESDYNGYYKQAESESTDKGKVKKLKALLWGENTRNTTELPTEVQLQEPRKITKAQDLFDVMIWGNVCQDRTYFNKLYTLDIGRQTNNYSYKLNKIIEIIHTKNVSEPTYNEKYKGAKEYKTATGASDKIDYLLNALMQLE